jgi:glycosyltransferase involved in cell wall biosynthesis
MILHMPWTRDLGGPRVSVEVADEFIRMGHQVDKFDLNDAFPRPNRLSSFFAAALFARRAVAHVRRVGRDYDVIQAEQGNLPVSRQALNFDGVLVARSNGLAHFYAEYAAQEARRKRQQGIREGTLAGNALRRMADHMAHTVRDAERSFVHADAIILINRDELEYVAATLGHRNKAALFHNGLSEARHAEFAAKRTGPGARLAAQQVVFVGSWNSRKGAEDFPALVRMVRQARPETTFLLLGTGAQPATIRAYFDPRDRESVQMVPRYTSAELPALLARGTVGLLPSYIEGFGLGVLESLAAGIPTLAYDVPGPREMLRQFDPPLLTPAGDIAATATRLVDLLSLPEAEYAAHSRQAVEVAGRFRWQEVACDMIALYEGRRRERGLRA